MPGIRELTTSLLDALAAFEPGRYSGADCAELAELLARTAKASESASVRFAARAAECGEHRRRGYADISDWVAASGGSSRGAARAALDTLATAGAETQDALVAGEVSLAQAAEIASAPAECEGELLEVARTSGLGRVKEVARKRRLAAIDVDSVHAARQAAREFVHWQDGLGMVRFRGALPPEVGISFVNRLDAETDRVWRAARRAGQEEVTREQCAADAFDRMTRGQSKGKTRGPDLVVVADLNAYRRGHVLAGEVCQILGGGPIPVAVARELGKDAFLKVVLHDGVQIHTVSHVGRYRPAELETALMLGAPPDFDGVTCSEVGCDRRYGLQWDHLDPVANDGPTRKDNLDPKCPPHHQDKTERDRQAGRLKGKRKDRGP